MERKFITVTTLNKYLKNKFDTDPNIQRVSLKGEISNFKGHSRGHLYFTLKDEQSRINAVMFSFNAGKLTFIPEDGMKVLVIGRVSIYEATGAYQIYIESMEEDGIGNLHLKFEALKKELSQKGLFDEKHKKEIPKYPEKIGIITAPTGAAIKDILTTLKRRYPAVETILFPSLVQGPYAKDDLIKQLKEAENYDLDLLIIGRGGGSIEDLWPFNEEDLAYAIYDSKIPIISAVGHEIDFTISDFVADLRAPTPTAAAELAVPNISNLNILLKQYYIRSSNIIKNSLDYNISKLKSIKENRVLTNPLAVYEVKEEKLSIIITNLNNYINNKILHSKNLLNRYTENYVLNNPESLFKTKENNYQILLNKLELLNPISILNKGYSIVKIENKIIKNTNYLKVGDNLNIKLSKGYIDAKIEKVGKE